MAQPTTNPSLSSHLSTLLPSPKHTQLRTVVLPQLLKSVGAVAKTLRSASKVSAVGTANAFGDAQLNVDVLAENRIREALSACGPCVATASSEEDPVERAVEHKGDNDGSSAAVGAAAPVERYTVAFDPLDGSSIIAPNWSVGAIFGVWQGTTALHQLPSEGQIASVIGVLGPRTTAFVAVRTDPESGGGGGGGNCFEVAIDDDGEVIEMVRPEVRLPAQGPFKTRYFAPANLRWASEDERYMRLITRFIGEKWTLRYCGGLVPDVAHGLTYGHGVYVNPIQNASKAKLRRLYELCPIALLVECAGGKAVDPLDGSNVLAKALEDVDERGGVVFGTSCEVDMAMEVLLG